MSASQCIYGYWPKRTNLPIPAGSPSVSALLSVRNISAIMTTYAFLTFRLTLRRMLIAEQNITRLCRVVSQSARALECQKEYQ